MVAALLALSSACGTWPLRPPGTDIRLSVRTEPAVGSPSNPVSMEAIARNAGFTEVMYFVGCGADEWIQVVGSNGTPVLLDDPLAPQPLCAGFFAPLAPGAVAKSGRPFDGTLYVTGSPTYPSPSYPAPSGIYTVVARFGYVVKPRGESRVAERRTTFEWHS
jgi:hypothetical protein